MAEPLADQTYFDPGSQDTLPYWTNYATECFYRMHAHDATGVIHQEDPNDVGTPTPPTGTKFTLGQWFAVWGVVATPTTFQAGTQQWPIQAIYWNGPGPHGPCNSQIPGSCETGANQLQLFTGDPNMIQLYSHTTIWIELGTGNPDAMQLPGVSFFEKT